MNIVIASADPHWPAKAAEALRASGHGSVHRAKTVESTLDLLRADGIGLVVLGLDLPDRPGLQALETLKARYPHTHVVLVHHKGAAPSPIDMTELGAPPITTWEGLLEDAPDLLGSIRTRQHADEKDERVRAQELRHLHEMEEMRAKFLNITAHELSTPLTPISMGLDLLEEEKHGPLNERQKETVRMVARNIAWLEKTVHTLRDATRMQERTLGLDRCHTDLGTLVASELDSLRAPLEEKALHVEMKADGPLPVDADRERIRQVASYLIDNARRFTPEGGTIRIRTHVEHDEAQVVVEDTGVGMTEDQLMGIFYPLAQLHDTTHETRSGAGLSLYLARGIIEAHGGRIWAESDGEGKGSRFTFTLPLAEATTGPGAQAGTVDASNPTV